MKKPFITTSIFIFIFTSLIAQRATVNWYSIEEALELQKKKPRKIMVDVYTDWCGWCVKMDKETFSHPVIVKLLNEDYYAVKFNAESKKPVSFKGDTYENDGTKSSHQFAITLLNGRMSYPSIAYLDENLQLLGAIPGFKTPAEMDLILNFIREEKYRNSTLDEYRKTFTSQVK